TYEEKLMQRALMQFSYPQNYDIVYEALKKADRLDLVGNSPKCLIPARKGSNYGGSSKPGERYGKNRPSGKPAQAGAGRPAAKQAEGKGGRFDPKKGAMGSKPFKNGGHSTNKYNKNTSKGKTFPN
ncbi:MAG: DUF3362 domain-containing protein, partial [Erysipelotrichaceae bacterium]